MQYWKSEDCPSDCDERESPDTDVPFTVPLGKTDPGGRRTKRKFILFTLHLMDEEN